MFSHAWAIGSTSYISHVLIKTIDTVVVIIAAAVSRDFELEELRTELDSQLNRYPFMLFTSILEMRDQKYSYFSTHLIDMTQCHSLFTVMASAADAKLNVSRKISKMFLFMHSKRWVLRRSIKPTLTTSNFMMSWESEHWRNCRLQFRARTFRTHHGLLDLNFCRRNRINNCNQTIKYDDNNDNTRNNNNSNNNVSSVIESGKMFYWNLVVRSTLEKKLDNAYEKLVHCKNMFMLPSGAVRTRYVDEVTRLMKLAIQDNIWR